MPTKRKTYSLVCSECGREFEWEGSENATSRMLPKCCSAECRKSRTRKLDFVYDRTVKRGLPARGAGDMTGAELSALVEELKAAKPAVMRTTCQWCGKEFEYDERHSGFGHVRKYCSKECQNKGVNAKASLDANEKSSHEVECAVCHKKFWSVYPHAKYCSKRCKYIGCHPGVFLNPDGTPKDRTRRATCPVCGKEFVTDRHDKKYCSRKCSRRASDSGSACNVSDGKPVYEKTCPVCGKEFRTNTKSKTYCSARCRKKAGDKPSQELTMRGVCKTCGKEFEFRTYAKSNPSFWPKTCPDCRCAKSGKAQPAVRKCPVCGKEFVTVRAAGKNAQTYCSATCRETVKKRRQNARDRKPPRIFTCAVCGKEFESSRPGRKYCSPECGRAADCANHHRKYAPAAKTAKTCPTCGKTFETSNTFQKFCSVECRLASHARSPRPLPEPRKCVVCGSEFVPNKHHPHAKCCSVKCRKRLENGRHRYVRKPAPEPRTCKWCGETFVPNKHHPHKQCCSVECGRKFRTYGMSEVQRAFVRAGQPKALTGCMDFDRSPRKCLVCGKEFVPKTSTRAVCSRHCRDIMSARQAQAKRPKYERTCRVCGKPFVTTNKKRVTCSRECSVKNRSMWADIQQGKRPAEKVVVKAVCKECGKEFEYMRKGLPRKYCSSICCHRHWNRVYSPTNIHRLQLNLSPEEAAARIAEVKEKKRAYQKAYQAEYQKRPEVIAKKLKRAEEAKAIRAAKSEARREAKIEAKREARLARIAAAEEKRWAKILAVREKRRLVAAASAETRAFRAAELEAWRKATRERSLAALMKRHEEARAAARAKAVAANAAIAASARAAGKEVATAVCKECGCEFEYVPQDRKGRLDGTVPEFCCHGCRAHWKYTHGGKEKTEAYLERMKDEGARWSGRHLVKGMKKENLRTAWRGQVPGGFGCSCGFAPGGELRPEDLCPSGSVPSDAGFGEFDYDAYSGA